MKEKKTKNLTVVSIAAAVLLVTLVFKAAGRFPGDPHIFMVGDYYVQFMNYIVMFWRKLLGGNGLFYSFDIGLGAPTWEQYAFYGFSPFNFVFLLIKDADTAAFVLLLCKVGTIAGCMHLFMRYALKVKESIAVMFSVSYALCAYVMNFYFCIVLMDYLYLLPLVMLAMVHFFRSGRAAALAAAYGFSFLTAYYGGYMIGVFSFVCFIVMYAAGKYELPKKKLLAGYAFAVVTAVMISAVVTLPAAVALFGGAAGESGIETELKLFVWDIVYDMFPLRDLNEASVLPSVYCGLPALIMAVAFFADRERSGKERVLAAVPLIFLVLCTLFKPAYLMMHGFDEPNGYYFRFAYLYCFYMAVLAAKQADESAENFRPAPFIMTFCAYALLFVLGQLMPKTGQREPGVMNAAGVTFFLVLYLLIMKNAGRKKYILMCAVLFAELFVNAFYSITPDTQTLVRRKDTYDLWNRHGEEALRQMRTMDGDEQFYRVNFRDGMWMNDAMYFGYHGLGYFSSMEQADTRAAIHDLGYSTSSRTLVERGGSPFTEMILSQRYRVVTDPDLRADEPEKVEVTRNEYALPLAFMVSEDILNVDFGNDAFENQQRLADAMLGHEEQIWDEYRGAVDMDLENAGIAQYDDMYEISRVEPGEAKVTVSAPLSGEKAYAYLSTFWSGMDWDSPLLSSDMQGENVGVVMPQFVTMPAILPVKAIDGKADVYIRFKETSMDTAELENTYFAVLKEEGIKKAYAELCDGGMSISNMRDDRIEGSISSKDGQLMFTSIPYDKNWHIKVNGAEAETFPVLNGAFLACRMPAGVNDVEIVYFNKNICYGLLLFAAGMLMLILRTVLDIKKAEADDGSGKDNKRG